MLGSLTTIVALHSGSMVTICGHYVVISAFNDLSWRPQKLSCYRKIFTVERQCMTTTSVPLPYRMPLLIEKIMVNVEIVVPIIGNIISAK